MIALLVLSSILGAPAWAKPDKPDTPGKPSPAPETFDYQIWIGIGDLNGIGVPEDLVLEPYGNPLVVEDEEYFGGWLPPLTKTKGQRHVEGWDILLEQSDGEYCGTYEVNDASLVNALTDTGFSPINEQTVYRFAIQHKLTTSGTNPKTSETGDSWFIMIQFENGTMFSPLPEIDPSFVVPYFLVLQGETDTGVEPEGAYDEDTDTWTVSFHEVWFHVLKNWGENEGVWTGQLSFTVNITRTPVQSQVRV